ncbi:MAG: DNA polymerase III subunit alpha [Gemmatimonadota bacterium]
MAARLVGLSGAYVELAARSAFSLLDGASTPETLAERAAEVGLPALALADLFDLGGAVRFTRACERLGVRPILGAEVRVALRGSGPGSRALRLVLLCGDRSSYHRLSRLITRARLSCPRGEPSLSLRDLVHGLGGCGMGLVCLLRVATLRRPEEGGSNGLEQRDRKWIRGTLRSLFGERFFLLLEHHGLPEDGRRCREWIRYAEEEGIPWVPSNAPRYARPADRIAQDVLTCLRFGTTLEEAGDRLLPNGEWYLKSAEQMAARWCLKRSLAGEASAAADPTGKPGTAGPGGVDCDCGGCRGLRRTVEVSRLCRFRLSDLEPGLPCFPIPGGRSSDEFLRGLVEEGARDRYGARYGPKHRRQIAHELRIIDRLGLADYFLIVWDIVRFARRRGILLQGRGSAANSAVCYCLGITAVDPIGLDLLFERFLSEEREGAPDIDLDIAHRDREEVLQYVYERYGRDHAAMVCETITYRGRMAVRDAARVLGLPPQLGERLSLEVDRGEALDAARRLAAGGLSHAGLDPRDPRAKALVRAVAGLHELPRHRSIHVGGFVLTACPIGEVVPVEAASMPGRTVIQWDKDDLDLPGLIKFDLLGLGMLTVLGEAFRSVRRTRGVALDLARLPPDDPAVYDMICEADTVGVFQIESRAQMNTLPRVKPRCFYDLVIEVALIRPGPIQGDMVHPYLRRRRGEEPVTYLDPRLEPVLRRTLGVPLFQEQGMKVAITLAGYTAAQADRLRQAMGFKRSGRAMEEVGRELDRGLKDHGVPPEIAERIFRQLTAFANYGFPESHAASFALLVYASAYLKRYYAPEFFCAMLNAQPMGFYAPSTLVRDAQRHGVEVRPVDLARSDWDCTLEAGAGIVSGGQAGPALRLGLRLVRGLGRRAREKLRSAREAGPFTSVQDVVCRSGLGRAELRRLAEAGAFESLWPGRREALWELLHHLRGDAGPLAPRPVVSRRALPRMNRPERVLADYRALGLSAQGHPMEFLREQLERRGVLRASELRRCPAGSTAAVAGIPICRQRPGTAKGVMFVTLEDETGLANFIVLPEVQERYHPMLLGASVLLLKGIVERDPGVVNVRTSEVQSLAPGLPGSLLPSRDFR